MPRWEGNNLPFEKLIPHPFTDGAVRVYAPAAEGVYGISNSREWLFIGQTDNIQGALLQLLRDAQAPLMQRDPTGFVFEICGGSARSTRQDRLTVEYKPKCNGTPQRPSVR
jgi:hypothetical protein